MSEYTAIGLMSGSSLDGLDLVLTRLANDQGRYHYSILDATTMPYPETWKNLLADAFNQQPETLDQLDKDYGDYLGSCVNEFLKRTGAHPDFVASHGHTIFHQPERKFTLQIGHGQTLADRCGLLTVNDFRSEDVGKGGQGAPLVPIGDRMLFGAYDLCLNIGGIANISYEKDGRRIAYDICIANQALNELARREGQAYDHDGGLARKGKVNTTLLEQLNALPYFRQQPPKSLGREFFEQQQRGLLQNDATANLLATFCEHIALQIGRATEAIVPGKLLVTGGGAFNGYLIGRIQQHSSHRVIVPDRQTVEYKEALIFALLGLLRLEGRTNVLSSVTGAPTDSCSGAVWKPRIARKQ